MQLENISVQKKIWTKAEFCFERRISQAAESHTYHSQELSDVFKILHFDYITSQTVANFTIKMTNWTLS